MRHISQLLKKGVGFMDDDVNVRRILIQICTKNDDWAVIFIMSLETGSKVEASARFMDGWGKKKTMSLNINENCSELNQFLHNQDHIHQWHTFGRTGHERAVGRPRPEPGLLTP